MSRDRQPGTREARSPKLPYPAFGWLNSAPWLIAVFLAYGIYFGLVEPGSVIFGLLWQQWGAVVAFSAGGGLAALAALLLAGVRNTRRLTPH